MHVAYANLIEISVSKTSQFRDQIEVAVQYARVNEDEHKEGGEQAREVAVEQLLRAKMTTALNTILLQCIDTIL